MNTDRVILLSLMIPVLLLASAAEADREPVLSQITAPHNYYFREMYLPRVTTGPSSPAWMPSGRELVYSMQGSIWRQSIDSETAVQITDGDGYDSQPDVAPDGRRVVFSRYDGQSVELFVLDLVTGNVTALTNDGNVNVDPRWSPDGESIAFVSTRADGRFRVFAGRFERGAFIAKPLREQRKSNIDRYYYSSYDHELSPAWLPEGNGLVLIANPETPYGTGSLWLQDIAGGTPATMVQREETSWKAQPDVAPDGKRVAYASYLGQQWHQLWVTRVSGEAEPFPLTYGEFDVTEPRWSPDGERIAYVINESGNTSIRIQEFVGGRTIDLEIATYRHLIPHGQLELQIVDDRDQPVAARVSVIASDGRSYAPPDSWMHADDGFDRDVATFETHYFHSRGQETLALPAGPAAITVWRGLESHVETRRVKITAGGANRVRIKTRALDLPTSWSGWQSGDVHVHMNYGGTYRNTPDNLAAQAGAEDLDFVFNLIVNKEQRIPDIAYFTPRPDPVSNDRVVLLHSQEFHTSHWGHQGLLGLNSHLLIPDYAAYPYTAAASLYPDNATIAKLAREQGALVGYVHPFDPPAPDPRANPSLSNALPVDAALGLVDYYEVVGFADPHVSASVWYRLMNCGLRVAAAGGTDAMANYASLRGPVGVNRSYVKADDAQGDPAARRDAWLQALQRGRSFATNGPLLGFSVAGHEPGDALDLEAGSHELNYSGFMRSAFQVDHVEVVFNGEVVDSVPTAAGGLSASIDGSITLDESGWLLLRAWSESSDPLLFDLYPYATTTPVWVTVDGRSPASREDAEYFIDWIDRLRQTAARHPGYNSENERTKVLAHIDAATTRFEKCRQ